MKAMAESQIKFSIEKLDLSALKSLDGLNGDNYHNLLNIFGFPSSEVGGKGPI